MIEKLCPATTDLLHTWLADALGGGGTINVRPVIDLGRTDAVDSHDPPDWMRELVILRDVTCVFPGCSVDARRCDLDHIDPYLPIDQGGPPGQTSPDNLACLCRRHHRAKTHGRWTYHRAAKSRYRWTSPAGQTRDSHQPPPPGRGHYPRRN